MKEEGKKDPDSSAWLTSYTTPAKSCPRGAESCCHLRGRHAVERKLEDWKVSAETKSEECQCKCWIVHRMCWVFFHTEAFLLPPPVLIQNKSSQLSVTKLLWSCYTHLCNSCKWIGLLKWLCLWNTQALKHTQNNMAVTHEPNPKWECVAGFPSDLKIVGGGGNLSGAFSICIF